MKKISKYMNYTYVLVVAFIGLDVIARTKADFSSLAPSMGLYLLLIISNYLRYRFLYKSKALYYGSIGLNIIGSIVLTITVGGYIDIFFFMLLFELMVYNVGTIANLFTAAVLLSIIAVKFANVAFVHGLNPFEFWLENSVDFAMVFVTLFFYCLCLYGYRTIAEEKRKVERLNRQIEELTKVKERNRVAEEIHDNLGHSLIALNMNLDVATKTIGKDPMKTKELLEKSLILAKDGMDSLRQAVYALKMGDVPSRLKDFNGIMVQDMEGIRVQLNMDEELEGLLTKKYRDALYPSLKELLTNSIKHGKASEVTIECTRDQDWLKLTVTDNGLGCLALVKGNGLTSIANRIAALGGEVIFCHEGKPGFPVILALPL